MVEGNVQSLDAKRRPVNYTLRISHHYDGTVECIVEDVQDDPASRAKLRLVFAKLAARWLEPDDALALMTQMAEDRMDAKAGDLRGEELEALGAAVSAYEQVRFP